ncbi:hypothetical protein CY34DRAFT_628045 [Suillus luteus UH-Slu-Lm8-n1]|uniref:Uncharacterized protein n=1 Tax=Suillus luteus UH-Slu-Lm8-n1 TaxID=930992 RepID=A0A0D0AE87_9AGAM|nr:hypothetical protein CY34DRAFT_628045 [Suillus luteus UH-Slu-Lm8-n1]
MNSSRVTRTRNSGAAWPKGFLLRICEFKLTSTTMRSSQTMRTRILRCPSKEAQLRTYTLEQTPDNGIKPNNANEKSAVSIEGSLAKNM